MTVRVDEIHTEVIPSATPGTAPAGRGKPEPLGAAEDKWHELRKLTHERKHRVAAEGFDD